MAAGNNEGEVYYLAEAAADRVLGEGNYEVLAKMKGKELEFDEYERLIPGSELNKKSHFVGGILCHWKKFMIISIIMISRLIRL